MIERVLSAICGLCFFGLGVWMLVLYVGPMRAGTRVEGRVTGYRYRRTHRRYNSYAIIATFVWNGKARTQECINAKSMRVNPDIPRDYWMADWVARQKNKPISVWYNPNRPSKTVCSPTLASTLLFCAGFILSGLLFLCLAFLN